MNIRSPRVQRGAVPALPRRRATGAVVRAACIVLLAESVTPRNAAAAEYLVSTEAELRQAVQRANADADTSATIRLTANITIASTAALPATTKPLTIETQAFTLAGAAATRNGVSLQFPDGARIMNSGGTIGGGSITGASPPGTPGQGIRGANLSVVNAGMIDGGTAPGGIRANAIVFTSGTNVLELQAGWRFGSSVVAGGGDDTLVLGGAGDSSLSVSLLGFPATFSGFEHYRKTGGSTWTLTGSTTTPMSWHLMEGTLSVANDANLGGFGALTFAGGTLRNTAPILTARAVTLEAGGGTFQTASDLELMNVVDGPGALRKTGSAVLTLSAPNTYAGGTVIAEGTLSVQHDSQLGAASGALVFDGGTLRTMGTVSTRRPLTLGGGGGTLQSDFELGLAGVITGPGSLTKTGAGRLTLSGPARHAGATNVAQGALRAGAANTFSAASAHNVAAGATLDLAGFNQTVASLTNSGTVSLLSQAAGTTLTVNGNYVGNNGVLKLGTALNGMGPSDRLVINGGTASGRTSVQITNLGGLGALTTGNGIEVVTVLGGATTTAETTKDAFSLAGGHVDAGAYEYRLHAADAHGAGENWYLRSTTALLPPQPPVTPATPGAGQGEPPAASLVVPTYRPQAALYAALPNQLRQGNLAMLGDLRKRVGDDDVKGAGAAPTGPDRRAWARMLSTDIDIQQGGAVSPKSKGRLTGFQAGTDLLATPNWRAGIYVGQFDGDARVSGFASGIQNLGVGRNDLRSQYFGIYGTYTNDSGFYADAVVQSGRHRYTVEPNLSAGVAGKGNSLLGSIEVGQAFAIGGSGWTVEPQLQLIHQHMDLSNSAILGAIVQPQVDSGWIARAGVRVKGKIDTGMGTLQPYGRFNVYKTSRGADVARFVNGATTTDIAAPTGSTSTELAGGFTLALNPSTSLYGEVGKLWSSGGDAKVKGGINASLGVRVKW